MLKVVDLKKDKKTILTQGLNLEIGPFTINIKSSEKNFAETFCHIYQNFPIVEQSKYIDFYIDIRRPSNLRKVIRPYINFNLDGKTPFKPLSIIEAFPFFEWGLNWCVATHAHHYFMLHAAVVEKNGHVTPLWFSINWLSLKEKKSLIIFKRMQIKKPQIMRLFYFSVSRPKCEQFKYYVR